MSNAKQVNVKAPKNGHDGYEGLMYVIERSGDDYGLSRHEHAYFADVWIHKQRVEEIRACHHVGLVSVEGNWPA